MALKNFSTVTSKITEPKAEDIMSMIVSGKRVDLTPQDVLLGKEDAEIEMLNYFITLVELNIWTQIKEAIFGYFGA